MSLKSTPVSILRKSLSALFIVTLFGFLATSPATAAKWTVLVYLDADCDLEQYGIADLNEMETVGSTNDVNIIVQIDRSPDHDQTNGDWTETRRYYVTKDNDQSTINSNLLQSLGEKNMGDPQTLKDFIVWGKTNYPADNYFLILWNHGGGWKNLKDGKDALHISQVPIGPRSASLSDLIKSKMKAAGPSSFSTEEFVNPFGRITWIDKDVCYDDTDQDHLSNAEVVSAITDGGLKLDIIGFDACLMAMLENEYPLRNLADYMIASEETEPGDGYPYNNLLPEITVNPDITPSALAQKAIIKWGQYYESSAETKDVTTQSAVSLAQVDNIITKLDAFVAAAKTDNQSWSGIMTARAQAHSFNNGQYIDLWHFCNLVADNVSSSPVIDAAGELKTAITDAVIANYVGNQFANAKGISIYFPNPGNYEPSYGNNAYGLDFIASTDWASFLQAAYNSNAGDSGTYNPDDKYEPNNNWGLAYGPVGNEEYKGVINDENDVEFFRIETGNSSGLEVSLQSPADINFDLIFAKIEGDSITIIDYSQLGANETDVVTLQLDAGIYYAIVNSQGDVSNEQYTLTFSGITEFNLTDYDMTLAYDNGGYTGLWQISSTVAEEGAVSLYRLPKSPARLKKIWYYVSSLQVYPQTGSAGSFYYYAFDYYGLLFDNGQDGLRYGTPPSTGWVYVDLKEDNITLYGDFGVGLMFDGVNSPGIGYDTLSSFGTNLIYVNPYGYGYDWYETPGLFFIRAEISYGDGATDVEETFLVDPCSPLQQNIPNPFSSATTIPYSLEKGAHVSMTIYSSGGSLVMKAIDEYKEAGKYIYHYTPVNMAPGTYYCILTIDGKEYSRKMINIK